MSNTHAAGAHTSGEKAGKTHTAGTHPVIPNSAQTPVIPPRPVRGLIKSTAEVSPNVHFLCIFLLWFNRKDFFLIIFLNKNLAFQ